jgi:hypothetical protein
MKEALGSRMKTILWVSVPMILVILFLVYHSKAGGCYEYKHPKLIDSTTACLEQDLQKISEEKKIIE